MSKQFIHSDIFQFYLFYSLEIQIISSFLFFLGDQRGLRESVGRKVILRSSNLNLKIWAIILLNCCLNRKTIKLHQSFDRAVSVSTSIQSAFPTQINYNLKHRHLLLLPLLMPLKFSIEICPEICSNYLKCFISDRNVDKAEKWKKHQQVLLTMLTNTLNIEITFWHFHHHLLLLSDQPVDKYNVADQLFRLNQWVSLTYKAS